MLKTLRRKIKQRNLKKRKILTVALCTALVLSTGSATSYADNGKDYTLSPSGTYNINENISTSSSNGIFIIDSYPPNTADIIVNMSNHSISASGSKHAGVLSFTQGNFTLNLTNVDIETHGDSDHTSLSFSDGVVLCFSAGHNRLNMNGGSITTIGNGSNGIHLYYPNNTANVVNVAIQTQGTNGSALYANSGASIAMNGGSLTSLGNGSFGAFANSGGSIYLTNVAIQTIGTALYTKGYIYSYSGSTYIKPGTITATADGQSITGGTYLLYSGDYGTIDLTASNGSQLSGMAYVSGIGSTANLIINNATWFNTGNSGLTNLTLNSGNVRFTTSTTGVYHTLTVKNLAGSGGAIYVNSDLNTTASDKVIINGSASGSQQMYSHILSLPSNLYQAVPVVQFSGSATNTATFGGGGDISSYRYGIAKGSALSSAYSVSGNASDYYLYNTFAPSTPVRAAMSTGTSVNSLWYGEMNDIKKRMGELRMGTQKDSDIWARTYATEYRLSPSGGSDYKQIVRGVEIGKDHPEVYSDGKNFTGMVLGAGHASNSFDEGGSGKAESFYLGAYKSWFKNDGSYLDIIGKYNWFKHDFDSPIMGGGSDSASFRNTGFGLSAEIGKRFEKKDGYFIEPQLELSAFWSGKADYSTDNGLNVETDRGRSLQLRAGGIFGKQTTFKSGDKQQIYGKIGWVREFAGENEIQVDSASFDSSLKGNQLVAGLGIVTGTPHYQLYFDAEKSWGKTTSKAWGVDLGCRWKY